MLEETGWIPKPPECDEQGAPLPGWQLAKARRASRDVRFFLTNVCKYRPPENKIEAFFLDKKQTKPNELILEGIGELRKEITHVRPKLILALGGTALWALTGQRGITKWRGSMLEYDYTDSSGTPCRALLMPTYHPALILREWSWRAIACHDLRRAREALERGSWPARPNSYIVRPSFEDVMDVLGTLQRRANEASSPIKLSSDLETRGGHIACHGIAWSSLEAICIPNMCVERPTGYFTLDQDVAIWERERALLTHPHVEVVGQNYLYDAQYFARRRGYVPRVRHDTMFQQLIAYAGLPKGLDFLSSMYCKHHVYWKDEGKEWNPKVPEDNLWVYNCDDCSRAYEIHEVLQRVIAHKKLTPQYEFQMELWWDCLDLMLRGVRVDQLLRGKIAGELLMAIGSRQQRLDAILGRPFNPNSPPQMQHLFYKELRCQVVFNRKTKRPTCDEDALKTLVQKEPLLKPITDLIVDLRALGAMMSNVIQAPLDSDGRLRSMFSPTKETLRWSSSKNAWGGGTNLQNWTKGDEDKEAAAIEHTFPVPNVRKLIVPDLGFEIASVDLTGADAQAVAWEANDEDLKRVFRENKIKIHAYNAMQFYGERICPTGYEQPYYDRIRTGIHLINYGGREDALAPALNATKWECKEFIARWFELHPAIADWHDRILDELQRTRTVRNAFGYERMFFDRIEGILPDALAWIGQSNTACVTNRALRAVRAQTELCRDLEIQFLLQVHDELVFQYPIAYRHQVLSAIKPLIHITVPYPDPLIIPWGLKTSTKSWGDCEKREWPV